MKFTSSITIASLLFTSAFAAPVKRQSSDGGEGEGVVDPVLGTVSSAVGATGVEDDTAVLSDIQNGATDNEGVASEIFGNVNGIILRRQDGGEGEGVADPVLETVSSAVGGEGDTAILSNLQNGATDNEGVASEIFGNVNGIILRRDDSSEGEGVADPVLETVSSAVGGEGDTAIVADLQNGVTDNEGVASEIFGNVNGIVARQVQGGNGAEDINVDNPLADLAELGSDFLEGTATVIS